MIADDPADFATAVTALYTDELLWAEVSRRGRENVRDHFSVEAVGRYENLLAFAEESARPATHRLVRGRLDPDVPDISDVPFSLSSALTKLVIPCPRSQATFSAAHLRLRFSTMLTRWPPAWNLAAAWQPIKPCAAGNDPLLS